MEDFAVNWEDEDQSPVQLVFEGLEAQVDVVSVDIPDEPSYSTVDSISAAVQFRCGRLFG